jgi:sulfonate transport system permease protein
MALLSGRRSDAPAAWWSGPSGRRFGRTARAGRAWAASVATALIVPVLVLAAYEAAFRAGLVEARLLPPPSRVAGTLWALARTGELWTHAAATLGRVVSGFALGSAVGLGLGGVTGASDVARRLLDPSVQALRAIPSLAWVPLFILWLGIFEPSKIALIATGAFFPVYLGTMAALLRVDAKLVEVGWVYGFPPSAMVRRIYLPAILPELVTALRSGLGLGFMFVVAAEIMGASEGLGYLLVDGQQLGKPDQILASIVAFALVGKALDSLLLAASRPFLRWQDDAAVPRGRGAARS